LPKVAVIMGSKSDQKIADRVTSVLDEYKVSYDLQVISAHRNPVMLDEYVMKSNAQVFIAIAGLSAALPGAIAAKTLKPVVGVPVESKLGGLDALLSIVQMPKGIPVATVGIDNGQNAAFLTLRILALEDPKLCDQLKACIEQKE
jgi:5-(carboxyamino)imidazole ribonucleotide mutase